MTRPRISGEAATDAWAALNERWPPQRNVDVRRRAAPIAGRRARIVFRAATCTSPRAINSLAGIIKRVSLTAPYRTGTMNKLLSIIAIALALVWLALRLTMN